ncbi:MAG: 23S rRNA (adenine(2503)-C(2))-methyltransferase RlmN [Bdellovibrionales bacterium]|nr:23S rRNA (adenine(2503)-C(2))-methyltransferase RlmN [Bdellovibrionales bacterium]
MTLPLAKFEEPRDQVNFYGLSRSALAALLDERVGMSRYRADQLFQWVYQKEVRDPEKMTNIKASDRERLQQLFFFPELGFQTRQISKDGTRKYLFSVSEDHQVESVMIKQPTRMTLCVSSQVGCALGCKFCRTGTMGLIRHLRADEILFQVLSVIEDARNFGDMFTNMVFMGMGEPLHNYDAVTGAIRILTDDFGLALSQRKITVSTVGLVPAIRRFLEEQIPANLAISLNATTNEIRSQIMPINRKHPIEELLGVLRDAKLAPRKRFTIEYVMLGGLNDTPEDLKRLSQLLRNLPCKINLIPYNDNAGLGYETPPSERVHQWQNELNSHGMTATIRWSKGQDIDAACGQLVTQSTKQKKSARLAMIDSVTP